MIPGRFSIFEIGVLVVVCGLTYLLVLQLSAVWPFTIDDMFISLRYARHWFEGNGLVWNLHEPPLEGYSNFSYVCLARLALSLKFNPIIVLKACGIVGLIASVLAVYALSRLFISARFSIIPCIWLVSYSGEIIWSISGLETTLYQALICWMVWSLLYGLGYRSDSHLPKPQISQIGFIGAGILAAAASLTRPEAPALCLLFILILVCQPQRCWTGIRDFALVFLALFLPYFLWRWSLFGQLFPNPVYCKGLAAGHWYTLDKTYLQLLWPFALLALGCFWQKPSIRFYFFALPSVLYLLLLINADPVVAFANRFFLPAFALFLPLALEGMFCFCTKARIPVGFVYLIATVWLLLFIPMKSVSGYRYFAREPLAGERLRERVSVWLSRHITLKTRIVLADAGLIPYRTDGYFIDSYCLNNAAMARLTPNIRYQTFCQQIWQQQPEIIILTSLMEHGKVIYTPADQCLKAKLIDSSYRAAIRFRTGQQDSSYRYELYRHND